MVKVSKASTSREKDIRKEPSDAFELSPEEKVALLAEMSRVQKAMRSLDENSRVKHEKLMCPVAI